MNENENKKILLNISDKLVRQERIFQFLQSLNLKPYSNNNFAHIQCRHSLYKIDIWPSTCRSRIVWKEKIYTSSSLEWFLNSVEKLSKAITIYSEVDIEA